MRYLLPSLIVCLFFFAVTVKAAGDVEAGKAKSASCVACHSTDGNSTTSIYPKLAGQHAGYLAKQLREYLDPAGGRANVIMAPMIKDLTVQDIEDLSAYFASQTTSEGYAKADFVALGSSIYRGGIAKAGVPACASCHSPTGFGNAPAGFPKLAGQHADYTISQLNQFKNGQRSNDPNGMMSDIAKKMTDKEIASVAQYIAGLH